MLIVGPSTRFRHDMFLRIVLPLAVASFLSGCGQSPWEVVSGQWTLHRSRAISREDAQEALALYKGRYADGTLSAKVRILPSRRKEVHLVFRYQNAGDYLSAGLEGFHNRVSIMRKSGRALVPLVGTGLDQELQFNREYSLTVRFFGNRAELIVDGAPVLSVSGLPVVAGNVGVRTWETRARVSRFRIGPYPSRSSSVFPSHRQVVHGTLSGGSVALDRRFAVGLY